MLNSFNDRNVANNEGRPCDRRCFVLPLSSNRRRGQLFSSGEQDQVIQAESPRSESVSTFPLSTNPIFSKTRNEPRFHARTVAHRRVRPVSWAAESIARYASVAYPLP